MAHHEIPLERCTLHGHFSCDLEPILTVDPGDSIAFECLHSGWRNGSGNLFAERLTEGDERDKGHALIGPVAVRGAGAGQTLEVRIDEIRIGSWGVTDAGGWYTPLNERLGVHEGENVALDWTLDADAEVGRDQAGRRVALRPFLGVIGMPPEEPGIHSTAPPRPCGGNIDCKELVAGTVLYLPIAVDGGLVSAGDGHAAQGDGEVSGTAIECPMERAELTFRLRDDLPLTTPIARTPTGWVTLGVHEDLDAAALIALNAMLDLLGRELGLSRRDALAVASIEVDLRVTQTVNEVQGVHALWHA